MADAKSRKLGPFLATMFVTGNMVGSGLFLLPATLGTIGGISIFTWLLTAAGALLVAGVYARLGILAPHAAGPYAYARATLGRFASFQTNYVYWLGVWVGNVGIALAATGYLAAFIPVLRPPIASALTTTTVIWLMVLANIAGPRVVGSLEAGAILVGVGPVLLLGILGWLHFDPAVFAASWNVSGQSAWQAVPASLVLVFWAFTGLETAAAAAEVIDEPKRNLPLAALAGVGIAALVYASTCTVLMGIVPARDLAAASAPFAMVAAKLFGPLAGLVISLTAILKATGTHGGWTLVSVSTARAAAEQGAFPAVFARLDRRGIPVPSLIIHGVLMTVVAFATMSPTIGQQFSRLIDVSVVLCLFTYISSALALYRIDPQASRQRSLDRALAVVAIAFSLWVMLASDQTLLMIALAVVLAGMPFFLIYHGRGVPLRATVLPDRPDADVRSVA